MEKIDFSKLTLSIIKPDAVVQRNASAINDILEKKGFQIILQKKLHISTQEAESFYAEHSTRAFFKDLCSFISSGPSIVQVLFHPNQDTIAYYREVIGHTNPKEAKENSIRKLYGTNIDYNCVHGSDSAKSSEREILHFFTIEDIVKGLRSSAISEKDIIKNI